ncbi:MAG: sulfatase-like hydrolase/transferase [Phycisphaerae bacterium]
MPKKRPNILLIVADDMGYGDFSFVNGGLTQTPALDALAAGGITLSQHYSASPVCAPARAALLTGRYPHRTGAIDTLDIRGLDRIALREKTLADLLKAQGYATGLVGKWHNGALDRRYHPNARGFDEFAGFCGGWQDYYRWRLDKNGTHHGADGRYLTDVFTTEAVEFIRRHRQGPFFLTLAYNAPHFPLQAPGEDVHPFSATGNHTLGVSILYGMIRRMDIGIGRVLETLDECGLTDDTLVIFTSDNGPQFGGDGQWSTTRFNCDLRGCKCTVWEGGIRVPAILRWLAGLEGGGRTLDCFVHFTDYLPTLLAVAGAEPPTEIALDGENVLPALRGERDSTNPRRFWQWNRYTPVNLCNAAMRDGQWKLVYPGIAEAMHLVPGEAKRDKASKYEPEQFPEIIREPMPVRDIPGPHPPELFKLDDDPCEQHNLADARPDRVAKMRRELEEWFNAVEADRASIDDRW